jgi:flavin-dependent dehydrogenase
VVRRHLATVEGVELRGGCTFIDYRHDDRQNAVEGVQVRDGSGEMTTLEADLVVDATGRTSRTPTWLAEHGYPDPPLDEVRIDLQYGTVQVRRPHDEHRTVLLPASYPNRRGGILVPIEGDRWLVNLHGFHGDHPPGDIEGFRRFADGLAAPVLADLLDDASVASESVDRHPIPSSRRYRYEDLDRFPEGLLVVGDALASFNPIYAQGMTVAAFEALVLHHALADGVDDLATRFFGAAASVVDTAWSLGVGPDFEFPETDGPRPSGGRIAGWYVSRLRRRARSDPVLTEALTRVIHFERPPSSLFHPRVMWRVLSPITGWFGSAEPESNTAGVTIPSNEE